MKVTIDSNICKKYKMSVEQVLLLELVRRTETLDVFIKRQVNSGIISKSNLFYDTYNIERSCLDKLNAILSESTTNAEGFDFESCYNRMKECYPSGSKQGKYPWRGSLSIFKKKMLAFFKENGMYDEDDLVNATKNYVNSFNGDYTLMRTLPHFIIKQETEPDEFNMMHNTNISKLSEWLEIGDDADILKLKNQSSSTIL